jgi:hypothetical protein
LTQDQKPAPKRALFLRLSLHRRRSRLLTLIQLPEQPA